MKYCASCGNEAIATMVMCPNCGHRSFSDMPNSGVQKTKPATVQAPSSDNSLNTGSFAQTDYIVPKDWLELPVTPWRRYAARSLDILFFGGIAFSLMSIMYYSLAPYSADQFFSFLEHPSAIIVNIVIISFLSCLLTGAIIGVSGSSLGKIIFGVMVTDQAGNKLGLAKGVERDLAVFLRGLGLGIPLINLVTMYVAYSKLNKSNSTTWDSEKNYRVWHRPSSPIQYLLNTLGIILIIIINALYRAF